MKRDVTFLVSSCDKYEDAWNPFFEMLHTYAGEIEYPIVLNTETKKFSSAYYNVRVINTPQKMTWSKRMMHVLSEIETEFVFLLLEDFFLLSPFDKTRFEYILQHMRDNPDVGYVNISSPHRVQENNYDFFYERDFNENIPGVNACWMGVNATIWRRDYMQKILRKHENIWEFEGYSGYRAKNMPYKILNCNEKYPKVYYYEWVPEAGYGIYQGKWLKKNVELFEKHGIHVNFENLGFYTSEKKPPTGREKLLHIVNRTIMRPYWKLRFEYRKFKSMH